MESFSIGCLIPSVQAKFLTRRKYFDVTSENLAVDNLFPIRRRRKQKDFSHIICRSRSSVSQDFQEFFKPSHLLPASEVSIYPMSISGELLSSLELDQLSSFYIVELRTSKDFGSSLKDLNAAILLCLIDENGRSILQRISSVSVEEKDMIISEHIHFQRGSIDTVTFKGLKLENILALWVGLESGSWRVDSIALKVINASPNSSSLSEVKENYFSCMSYEFEASNLSLGDGGFPVAELRPILAARMIKDNISAFSNINSPTKTPYFDPELSKERSMKEYADLKVSLLLYDFALIIAGAAILTVSSNEVYAYSFLAGGISGFVYLLLLQRSVDGLSVPLSSTEDNVVESLLQSYGGLKGPLMSLAFVVFAIFVSPMLLMGGTKMLFSSSDLFAGVAGFLTCKIAVVLAAFKPVQMSVKEDKN